ncbi:MAG: asparagine synthase (glutamine-hydrolyzing) [Candidatus Cloacimonetes bacterium 4572_55]|nr:MAG: asparagine synthase (glutamine-hydrolyzing) [Candidatus Cloacimonetes bacterium 4572_55]
MCGICGYLKFNFPDHAEKNEVVDREILEKMIDMIRHRGPDESGAQIQGPVGFGHARLSIIDLSTGRQPMSSPDGSYCIIFNGEIFNYIELRRELQSLGVSFRTASDTEVLLQSYIQWGVDCLKRLNGQFAFALWDSPKQRLFLARDRVGIRPLYYTRQDDALLFASEIKSFLPYPGVKLEIDPQLFSQLFTFWAPLAPQTPFRDVWELPPAHYLMIHTKKEENQTRLQPVRYWSIPLSQLEKNRSFDDYLQEAYELLVDATRIRLRSDVPVAAYLSGGLDSSATVSMILEHTRSPLQTFSLQFQDPDYDETRYQEQAVQFFGTDHSSIVSSHSDIVLDLPRVVRHAEKPLLRSAPGPLMQLSGLVSDSRIKVVITGEGADEVFGGYNIFRENKLRHFWARQPESERRPLLIKRLYPYLLKEPDRTYRFLKNFFRKGMEETHLPHYSHLIRWHNGERIMRFLSPDILENISASASPRCDAIEKYRLSLPPDFDQCSPLAKAQYIEIETFLSSYLISSQGDRMMAANGVEGRFPFLDHRLIELSARIPDQYKILGLNEKYLLKKMFADKVPPAVVKRDKQPYRAPILPSLFHPQAPDYATELLDVNYTKKRGYFNPEFVGNLRKKCERGYRDGRTVSPTEEMALTSLLTTHILHEQFIEKKDVDDF